MYNELEIVNLKIRLDKIKIQIDDAFNYKASMKYLRAVFVQKRKIEQLMLDWATQQKRHASN